MSKVHAKVIVENVSEIPTFYCCSYWFITCTYPLHVFCACSQEKPVLVPNNL